MSNLQSCRSHNSQLQQSPQFRLQHPVDRRRHEHNVTQQQCSVSELRAFLVSGQWRVESYDAHSQQLLLLPALPR
nr:uncharacterized protein [Zostera marina]